MPSSLRRLRKQARLTQADLAVLTDKTEAAISRFESGERRPAPDTVVRLARALGVSAIRLQALLDAEPYEGAPDRRSVRLDATIRPPDWLADGDLADHIIEALAEADIGVDVASLSEVGPYDPGPL
jgi:transcriptional regulator with XRE-family HTH domain